MSAALHQFDNFTDTGADAPHRCRICVPHIPRESSTERAIASVTKEKERGFTLIELLVVVV
jgi:hypothetical protein